MGYMNSAGQGADPAYLAYILGSTSIFEGIGEGIKTEKDIRNGTCTYKTQSSVLHGVARAAVCLPIGALEIAAGYIAGYTTGCAQKIFG